MVTYDPRQCRVDSRVKRTWQMLFGPSLTFDNSTRINNNNNNTEFIARHTGRSGHSSPRACQVARVRNRLICERPMCDDRADSRKNGTGRYADEARSLISMSLM